MRYVLAAILAAHGTAHLAGFAVPWRLVHSPENPFRTTILQGRFDLGETGIRVYGLFWLALAAGFAACTLGVLWRASWWLGAVEALVLCSLAGSLLSWPESRLGVPANLLALGLAFAAVRYPGPAGLALREPDLERLWQSARPAQHPAVRLDMRGEIKLGAHWLPFRAEQVITAPGEFVWAATVSMLGLVPIRGADRLLAGQGEMRWRLLDVIPVAAASGLDVTRSALGRLHGEQALWLPEAAPATAGAWSTATATGSLLARIDHPAQSTGVHIQTNARGRPVAAHFRRWGNPDGRGWREEEFGVVIEAERQFGERIIPSRVRAGWFAGTDRFESEGVFFRATIQNAEWSHPRPPKPPSAR